MLFLEDTMKKLHSVLETNTSLTKAVPVRSARGGEFSNDDLHVSQDRTSGSVAIYELLG